MARNGVPYIVDVAFATWCVYVKCFMLGNGVSNSTDVVYHHFGKWEHNTNDKKKSKPTSQPTNEKQNIKKIIIITKQYVILFEHMSQGDDN